MKPSSFRSVIIVLALGFVLPLQAQILQWERFPIVDSVYDANVFALTKTRFGLFTSTKNEQVLYSHDKGRTWQKAAWKGLRGDSAIFPGNRFFPRTVEFHETPSRLFTVIAGGQLCVSLDSGKTWEIVRGLLDNRDTNNSMVVGTLLAVDTLLFNVDFLNELYRSRDNGKTWQWVNYFPSADHPLSGFGNFFIHNIAIEGDEFVVLTKSYTLGIIGRLVSRDNGNTWRRDDGIPLPIQRDAETTVKRLHNKLFLTTQRIAQSGNVFFSHWLSNDSGKTWVRASFLDPKDFTADHIVVGSTVFLSTTGGIFTTRDNGETWQKESGLGVLPDKIFASFTLDGKILYAAVSGRAVVSGKGVYRADVSTITSVGSTNSHDFIVSPIAPNPIVSGGAELRFVLPESMEVQATLYNTLGLPVKEILRERITRGEHVTSFSTHDLPSGAYTCRITAGNHIIRQTVMIVK